MTSARKTASTSRASAKAARPAAVSAPEPAAVSAPEPVAPELVVDGRPDAAAQPTGGADSAQDFARANLDALMRANAAAIRGLDELGQAWIALAGGAIDQSVAATGAMLGARSLREVVELQGRYARTTVDRILSEGVRLSELGVRTANETIGPLNERVQATFRSFGRTRAS